VLGLPLADLKNILCHGTKTFFVEAFSQKKIKTLATNNFFFKVSVPSNFHCVPVWPSHRMMQMNILIVVRRKYFFARFL
jgi:hypothetical protein